MLRMAGASPVIRQTRTQLEERYCRCGRFIACPIFIRVERGLNEANQRRVLARQRVKTPSALAAS